jgi:hypothetical protein
MKVLPIDATAPKQPTARSEPELNLVPTTPAGERARQLLLQAKAVSLEHLQALEDALVQARTLSEAVVEAGDLYGPGLHDFAKRLAEELSYREKTLEALTERQRAAARG